MSFKVVSKIDASKGYKELGKFVAKFGAIDQSSSQVGFEAEDIHHTNTRGKKEIVNMSELAYWLHEGTRDGRIPPRPFFDIMFQNLMGANNAGKMKPMVARLFRGISRDSSTKVHIQKFLNDIGNFLLKETVDVFGSSDLEDNARTTIRLKGSDKPLIDGVTTNAPVQLKDAMKVKTSRRVK